MEHKEREAHHRGFLGISAGHRSLRFIPIDTDSFHHLTAAANVILVEGAGPCGVTVNSVDPDLRVNEDGSFVVMLGSDAPPSGWEANYVQTIPGRGWFP